MEIQNSLEQAIQNAFKVLFQTDISLEEISLQPTRKEFEGSHTFVTFPFSRISKKKPEETADLLGKFLVEQHADLVAGYNVVKGFLNLVLQDQVWCKTLENILQQKDFGLHASNGKKVVVEYSSPNTNKPLHLGHLRNNFLGYSVSKILEANGWEVEMVNLVNDRGIHICKSMIAYQKFGQGETPQSSGQKGDHLVGKYYVVFDKEYKREIEELISQGHSKEEAEKQAPLLLEAQAMLHKWENGDEETVSLWKKMNGWVYEGFASTYERMGVTFDKYYYESDTYLLGKDIVTEGLDKGVFFKKDDGSVWVDLTEEGLDEKLLLRGDGTSVYITQDLGTAALKYKDFVFDNSVYVVGNEQDYHFDVLFKILKKLEKPYAHGLSHLSYGMVDLPSGKMKSREGTVVDADDLMQEMAETAQSHTIALGKIEGFTEEQAKSLYEIIGMGALKYFLLKVDPKKRMLFNPEESIQFQGNTAPFIQYTHARIAAILRKADQLGIQYQPADPIQYDVLQGVERDLIHLLADFPEKVKLAGETYAPSVIAQYVYELAKEYNRFYAELSIFNEQNEQARAFRVVLSYLVAKVIKRSMSLLGINVPDRM